MLVGQQQGSNLEEGSTYIQEAEKGLVITGIKQYKSVGTNQINTTSTGFATQQKNEFRGIWIIELVDEFLSLGDRHRSIKSEKPISENDWWVNGEIES